MSQDTEVKDKVEETEGKETETETQETETETKDTEETQEEDESTTEEETSEEEQEEEVIPVSKVQDRIDELTATIKDLQNRINQQATTGERKKGATWDDYSDAELRNLKRENPDYADTVDTILEDRLAKKLRNELKQEVKTEQLIESSYHRIENELPEYAKEGTPEWKKSDEIFRKEGLANVPNGPYIAAVMAYNELNKNKNKAVKKLSRQLDKERAKKDLASGRLGKSAPTAQSIIDKLFEKAQGTSPNSPEWRTYFKALHKKGEE